MILTTLAVVIGAGIGYAVARRKARTAETADTHDETDPVGAWGALSDETKPIRTRLYALCGALAAAVVSLLAEVAQWPL